MGETRYSIFCKECGDDRDLIQDSDSGSFRCTICNIIYYEEDGIFDKEEETYYYELYKGEKLAGLVPDRDWDDDRDVW